MGSVDTTFNERRQVELLRERMSVGELIKDCLDNLEDEGFEPMADDDPLKGLSADELESYFNRPERIK